MLQLTCPLACPPVQSGFTEHAQKAEQTPSRKTCVCEDGGESSRRDVTAVFQSKHENHFTFKPPLMEMSSETFTLIVSNHMLHLGETRRY